MAAAAPKPDSTFIAYDIDYVPHPFGLRNTGVICYFNTLLQCVASCPSIVKATVDNAEYMSKTQTGKAFYNFMRAVQENGKNPAFQVDPSHSENVLKALVLELRVRRPKFRFGTGMESATESLILLMDMIEHPSEKEEAPADAEAVVCTADARATKAQADHPIFTLLHMRLRDQVCCIACNEANPATRGLVSERFDAVYQYPFFHYDSYMIQNPKDFVDHMTKDYHLLRDYKCEKCKAQGRPELNGKCHRLYEMRRIPNVLVVTFNQYAGHKARYYPQQFQIEGKAGKMVYILVGVANHSGSLSSGHYWARALRKVPGDPTPRPAMLNDISASLLGKDGLGPSREVYTLFYHWLRTVPAS